MGPFQAPENDISRVLGVFCRFFVILGAKKGPKSRQKSMKIDQKFYRFLESLLDGIFVRFGCQKGAKIDQKSSKIESGSENADFLKMQPLWGENLFFHEKPAKKLTKTAKFLTK